MMRHIEGGSMKPLLAVVGVALGLVFGVPAQADPGIDETPSNDNNGVFLADLQKVGIGYSDPNQATSAGQAVCACIHNGMSEIGIDETPSNDNNGVFLADLQKVGIGYSDPNQATSAGQAVCACIHNGMSGLH